MRTTSSFEIFPNEPSERELAKARWLRREGRLSEAEAAYRAVMTQQPGLRAPWTECFDLLRSADRADEALALADDAEHAFPDEAFPVALRGAALIEQGQFRAALEALERAVSRDPNLALTWHELGYAAYRIGDGTRALLALDRAFALEPHTETLSLRGRILREAGEFYAAVVAFEAAMHSATHDAQRSEIERDIQSTQRYGDFAPRRPRDLTAAERWFADHGTVVLAAVTTDNGLATSDVDLIDAFTQLARDRDWSFGQVIGDPGDADCARLAATLRVEVAPPLGLDPHRCPLLFAQRPRSATEAWQAARDEVDREGRGAVFILHHPIEMAPQADVVGCLERAGSALELVPDPATAVVMAQHPAAVVASRTLMTQVPVADTE